MLRPSQDLEGTAHRTYPTGQPELLAVLLRDQFIDALDSVALKVQVKQVKPANLREAWPEC